MIEELRRLLKHSGIYGVSVVLSKMVGFLMIPIYTRCLAPSDYGVLELLDLLMFLTGIFASMGIYSAVFKFYSAYESQQDKREVISSALLYYCAISGALSVCMILAAKPLAYFVFGGAQYVVFIRITAFTLFFSSLADVPQAYWRVQEKTVLFAGLGVMKTFVSILSLITALVILKLGLRGAVYANMVTAAIFGIPLFGWTLAKMPRRVVPAKLKEMLKYGAPLIVQSLGSFVLVYSDRFFLRHYTDLNEVGVYSLGYKLAGIVSVLVTGPFSFAWQWQQFEIAKREDGKRIQARIQTYQLLVSLLVGLGVSVLAKDILSVIAPKSYFGADTVVPLIVLSYIFANMRIVVASGVLVQRTTEQMALIYSLSAASNLALNWWLIPRFGMMGAAIATAGSYGFSLLLAFIVAQRLYYVPYEYKRNFLLLGISFATYYLSTLIRFSLIFSVVAKCLLLGAFVILAMCVLDSKERKMGVELMRAAVYRVRGKLKAGGERVLQP
ncbi:MAG: oligosaccharide flippase family protein [Terriglobia bacterium]|nr:oligosaccharide flippase family protein [Terriglobia bacterium]